MKAILHQHAQARSEAFGYQCNGCGGCCRGKAIQVNPYEAARLAAHLGIATRAFREGWTQRGEGALLAHKADNSCVFLTDEGCTVHPERPLVCRLYPLGRVRRSDGNESFTHVMPVPGSAGEYTQSGTIGDFVAVQDAQPFITASDAYADWVNAARAVLEGISDGETGSLGSAELLDMDEAVAGYCEANELPPPCDVEEKARLHLEMLYAELEMIAGGDDVES
ncbi:MAG: YkgJ family cysteine cluster protein [Novosphingobium sp.]|nr:YkgJ family cysteine cluster protein [Novosphingobium sp.]